MKRVWKFGRRLVSARVNTIILAAIVGTLFVVTQPGQYQPSRAKVYASSLETVALSMVVPPKPIDCVVEACIALTFDDGPEPTTTPRILDALESEGAKATFFVVGNEVPGREAILRREAALGSEIGNHSWSHPKFTKLSADQMQEQLSKTDDVIINAGMPAPHLFRPPYGMVNEQMLKTINRPMILWNVDPKDWSEQDPVKLAQVVSEQARRGAIIILHDSKPTTADAAKLFIHELKTRFHLVTVSELLQLSPDARGEFFGHPPQ